MSPPLEDTGAETGTARWLAGYLLVGYSLPGEETSASVVITVGGHVLFKSRRQAASLLAPQVADALQKDGDFQPSSAVVIGLPRGGVLVARDIALALRCPLDVLVSKTIGAPQNPDFLIGAVSSAGIAVLDQPSLEYFRVSSQYVETQKRRLTAESQALEQQWVQEAGLQGRHSLEGKWVVVVGDGVATGMTARTALRTVRLHDVRKLILAAPVMSFHAFRGLKDECDQLIALCLPYDFVNISQFYDDYRQIDDSQVILCLKQAAAVSATPV